MDDYFVADAEAVRISVLHDRAPGCIACKAQYISADHRVRTFDAE
jgi:hypothetical protein